MATLTRSDITYVVDETISAVAMTMFLEEEFTVPQLYNILPSAQEREIHARLGGISTWDVKPEGQSPTEKTITQEFSKQFVHEAYSPVVPLSRELIDDSKFNLVVAVGDNLGASGRRTMEKHGAALFNDAFNGLTHVGADGLSICNDAHVNASGGNSQDNSLDLGLSFANLQTARETGRSFTDETGEIIGARHDTLLVPNELEDVAFEMASSMYKSGGADVGHVDNFHKTWLRRVITWDRLTDDDAWFLIDPRLARDNLLWFQRNPIEFYGDGDLIKGLRRMSGYMRYSYGAVDWRWVVGSNAS